MLVSEELRLPKITVFTEEVMIKELSSLKVLRE